ncbi:hypothetical protein AGMMS50284_3560 [Clostridia bacterium]|nr:hypothetical protein AGMMS50284_3560 [Clostridia bacterium]
MDNAVKISRQSTALYAFARVVCTLPLIFFYKIKYKNRNSIKANGRTIICSNHVSVLDPLFLGIGQKRKLRFMAKAELFSNRFFAALIRSLGAFPIHRGVGDRQAVSVGEQILKDGGILGIFFEGKRSRNGEFLHPKSGAVMIAFQTDSPIVPACITAEKGLVKFWHKIRVSYGNPITAQDLGVVNGTPREFRDATRILMEKIEKLREEQQF